MLSQHPNLTQPILLATQQSFKKHIKSSRQPSDRLQLPIIIEQNFSLQQAMIKAGFELNNKIDMSRFFKIVESVINESKMYEIITGYHKNTREVFRFIKRNSKYPKVKDEASLNKEIARRPQGLLVDRQLLDFTYPKVDKSIERGIRQGRYLKIQNSSPQQATFYIFLTDYQAQYKLDPHKGTQFKQQYLNICKNINTLKHQQVKQKQQPQVYIQQQRGEGHINYMIKGFLQMKWQWKRKRLRDVQNKREEKEQDVQEEKYQQDEEFDGQANQKMQEQQS